MPSVAERPPPETPAESAPQEETHGGVVVPLWDGPLGALLVSSELLTSEQVEEALRESARRGRRLGEIIVERGWIHERTLANCLAGQKGLPFISLAETAIDRSAIHLLPDEIALRYGALPIAFGDGALRVAIGDPTNEGAMESVRAAVDVDIHFVVATPSELSSTLTAVYENGTAPAEPVREDPQPPAAPNPEPIAAPAEVSESVDRAVEEPMPSGAPVYHVFVSLRDSERADAGAFPTYEEATRRAKEVVRQIAEHAVGAWPLVNGRFLRPDGIISVDVVEREDALDEPLQVEKLG